MATFGELLRVADGHRAHLTDALDRPDISQQADHPGTQNELARLTAVLARYGDGLAETFTLPTSGDLTVSEAAHRFRDGVRSAREILGAPQRVDVHGPELAWTLRGTAEALGCGMDILASHFPQTPGPEEGAPSASASAISSVDSAVSLLGRLSEYTFVTGRIAAHSSSDAQRAAECLLRASEAGCRAGDTRATPADAVALRRLVQRTEPHQGESFPELIEGIGTSAQRLLHHDPRASIATWRYLATGAAIICRLDAHLLSVLAHRLGELGQEEAAAHLKGSAEPIRRIGMRWRTIAKLWNNLNGRSPDHLTAPAAVDAGDIVVRLGRLVYGDAAWTPRPGFYRVPVPPEQLAPDIDHVGRLGLTALRAVEACNVMAAAHRFAENDVARVLFARDGRLGTRGPRRLPRTIRIFMEKYEAVHMHGKSAAMRLGGALLRVPSTAATAAETSLIIHRSGQASSHASPALLAAQSFPSLTAQAARTLERQAAAGPRLSSLDQGVSRRSR